jgi:hypothetical protein
MPLYHVFQNAPFDENQIHLISTVFEQVSRELGLSQRVDAMRDLVAIAILDCAQKGIFDPFEMRKCAHEALNSG